ncbi:MAG: Rab family GTPase [Candidatus Thorarchaeota archaeon]
MSNPTESTTQPITAKRPYTHIAKAVVVGDASVGKTSLLVRYVKGVFNPTYVLTIGVAFNVKDIVVGEKVLRMQIWDTGGQERFGPIRQLYYRGAKGVLLVYDRSNMQSFERIEYWLNEVNRGCGDVPKVLVGNKADLDAQVSINTVKTFADEHSLVFVETSAKDDANVDYAFSELANLILGKVS